MCFCDYMRHREKTNSFRYLGSDANNKQYSVNPSAELVSAQNFASLDWGQD